MGVIDGHATRTTYAAASEIGCDPSTLGKWGARHGITVDANNQHRERVYGKISLPDTDRPPTDTELIAYLHSKGYSLTKNPEPTQKVHKLKNIKGSRLRLGVVSDTHLCSRYQQISHLHAAYNHFKQEGITDVLHAGDVTAGNGRVYAGQSFELFLVGADEQVKYAVENYPKVDGITTHIIAGNHDLSFMKSDGLDIVRMVAREREDWNYLGHYNASLEIGSVKVMLHHGDGGGSYARSYKLQKLIEQVAPDLKPNIFIGGHYHCNAILPMYRNVFSMLVGCFESQTPYLTRKGLYPEIGFYILEIMTDKEGVVSVKPEWIPNYVPIPNDF